MKLYPRKLPLICVVSPNCHFFGTCPSKLLGIFDIPHQLDLTVSMDGKIYHVTQFEWLDINQWYITKKVVDQEFNYQEWVQGHIVNGAIIQGVKYEFFVFFTIFL